MLKGGMWNNRQYEIVKASVTKYERIGGLVYFLFFLLNHLRNWRIVDVNGLTLLSKGQSGQGKNMRSYFTWPGWCILNGWLWPPLLIGLHYSVSSVMKDFFGAADENYVAGDDPRNFKYLFYLSNLIILKFTLIEIHVIIIIKVQFYTK